MKKQQPQKLIMREGITKTGVKLRIVVDNSKYTSPIKRPTFDSHTANFINDLAEHIDKEIERILRN